MLGSKERPSPVFGPERVPKNERVVKIPEYNPGTQAQSLRVAPFCLAGNHRLGFLDPVEAGAEETAGSESPLE